MARDYAKGLERLSRALTDPIIVYPPADPSSVPKDLKAEIQLERLTQAMRSHYGGKLDESTDAEALAYLMTASYVAPMNQEGYALYAHLFGRYMERSSKEPPEALREDIERYRELGGHLQGQLTHLKRWIQRQKDRHYRQQPETSDYEPEDSRKPDQLQLELFDERP